VTALRIVPAGPIRCAAQSWRAQGKPFSTLVIKITYELAADGSMRLAQQPDDVQARDVHREQNPTRSLSDGSDLSPYIGSGEVFFTGSAYVYPGAHTNARVRVTNGATVLVDKRFIVRGPPGAQPAELAVPVIAENALGGPGNRDNPVGRLDPLILHADDPSRPALLGPIARTWRARLDLLRPQDKKGLKGRELKIEDGFAWDYFRAAPADQRAAAFFSGDESIVLQGLQPGGHGVELRLPGARAAALWIRADGERIPIVLRADTLRIDGDRRRVSLTWRGFFETGDAAQRMVIAAALALPGRQIEWPDILAGEEEPPTAATGEVAIASLDRTGILQLDGLNAPTLPFAGSAGPDSAREPVRAAIPHAPWAAKASSPPAAPVPVLEPAPLQPLPFEPEHAVAAPARPVVAQLVQEPELDDSPIVLPPGLGSTLLLAVASKLQAR